MPRIKHTFKNGMEIILEEDHSSSVVSLNVLIKVGSAWEERHEWGIAHVIEHMLFKGTPKRPVGEIAKEVESLGGEINAYTSLDHTLYFINMASKFRKEGISILADAVKNSLFDPEELKKEKGVILEEIKRSKDNPAHRVVDLLFEKAYRGHPYGHPIIGTQEHVNSFKRKDLIAFFKKWYTPADMAVIVVGDFVSKDMLRLLKKEFGSIKKAKKPKNFGVKNRPATSGTEIKIERANVHSTHIAMGWRIPSIVHEDIPALDVLALVLGGSDSSRLEQQVKEKKQLVHQISASSYTPRFDGLMIVNAVLEEANTTKALQAILHEIDRISTDGISPSELERAKLNIKSNEVYTRETFGGESAKLAYFLATAENIEFEKEYYQKLHSTKTLDIKRVCKKYLIPENLSLSSVVPNGSKNIHTETEFRRALKRPSKKQVVIRSKNDLSISHLKNGITLVTQEIHRLPIVSVTLLGKGGLIFENKTNNGISTLTSRVVTKGTKNMTAIEIAKAAEKIAGYVDGISSRHSIGLKSEFLSQFTKEGFDLFSEVLTNPSFKKDEVEKEKRILIQEIKDEEDLLQEKVFKNFVKTMFRRHPYGLPSSGERGSVNHLTPDVLKKCYFNSIRRVGLVVSVVGDIVTEEVREMVESGLTSLPSGKPASPKTVHEPALKGIFRIEEKVKEKEQAHIVIGFKGPTLHSHDRFALTVLNSILAGQGGRLFQKVRDNLGLAYSIFSGLMEGIEPGYMAIYVGTDPAKTDRATNAILKELKDVLDNGVSKDDIDRAKQYVIGSLAIDSQRYGALSMRYASNELHGLHARSIIDYPKKISEVTKSDVLDAAHKYLTLNSYVISVLKPM